MLELEELKELQDKMFTNNQTTRERAADDTVFYWVTQWDDSILDDSQLEYKGEFNILRKAGRQIISDLRANPVQVDFDPKAETRDDGADLIDGLYRSDDRVNSTLEAYDNAAGESVVCGVGGWELYTDYESTRTGNRNQVIRRRPIYEANNTLFWDDNAKALDKSDANYACLIVPYSHEGYEKLYEELKGEEIEADYMSSFSNPEKSYVFPWLSSDSSDIYVGCFYHREKVDDKLLTMEDPFGQEMILRASDLDEVMDELIDTGYSIKSEKKIKRWAVTKYIVSGAEILKTYRIAGEHIPLVPVYGERAFVEGEEHYEGVTKLAKDPSRLRNFMMSYIGTIASRSPRPKPIFYPEQIQGFEFMYEDNGADSNYPYNLQNRTDANGNELPIGPVAQMPDQPVPQAVATLIEQTRVAVEDVANPGLPQDIADPDLSGKAVALLQNRLDQQSMVYQQNMKHAKRRDAEIYASMASEVYDAPREVMLTGPDGKRKRAQVMETVIDRETGDVKVLNDITSMEFEVFADIGPSYSTRKEQTIEQLSTMATEVAASDPAMHKMLTLKRLTLIDGVNMDDIREYANKQLLLGGFREPETEEEMMLVAQAQQNQQPDPNMLIGQAEMMKGQAQVMREQRENAKLSVDAENKDIENQIDQFRAETDRLKLQVDAQKAGADINLKDAQTVGHRVDTALKTAEFRARLSPAPARIQ